MSNIVETISKMIETLPENMHQAILDDIRAVIAEKQDEAEWDKQLQQRQKSLIAVAKEVKNEIAAGKVEPLDFKRL